MFGTKICPPNSHFIHLNLIISRKIQVFKDFSVPTPYSGLVALNNLVSFEIMGETKIMSLENDFCLQLLQAIK